MTGEGIGQALLTGRLAAEAIARRRRRAAGADYERAVRPRARRRPPDVGAPRPCARAPPGRDGPRLRSSPTPAARAAATSPAGCSRTSRGPSSPRPAGGTAGSSSAPAPTADRRSEDRRGDSGQPDHGTQRSTVGPMSTLSERIATAWADADPADPPALPRDPERLAGAMTPSGRRTATWKPRSQLVHGWLATRQRRRA